MLPISHLQLCRPALRAWITRRVRVIGVPLATTVRHAFTPLDIMLLCYMLLHSGASLLTSLSCSCDCAQLTGQPCQDGERLSPSLWRPEATYISLCRPASPANVWNCSCSSKTSLGHLSRLEQGFFANRCCVAEQYSVFLERPTIEVVWSLPFLLNKKISTNIFLKVTLQFWWK